MRDGGGDYHDPKAQFFRAALGYLHARWPDAVTIKPSTFEAVLPVQQNLFVEVIQSLIDEGLISVEFFIIGSADEPMARETVLTRKGSSVRLE